MSSAVRSIVGRVRDLARASPWARVVGRVAMLGVGLVVLAAIGRVTAAPATAATPKFDARPAAAPPDAGAPVDAAAPAIAIATGPPAGGARVRASPEAPVYVNHAGADELERLPGVGPKRAEAILALRRRLGRFQRVEDLLKVKGIGRATVRKWRPLIRLDAP